MKMNHCRKFLALLLAFVLVLSMVPAFTVSAADSGWTVKPDSRIFWVKTDDSDVNDDALVEQIRLFSSHLAEKVTGTALNIVFGEEAEAGDNDILLILDKDLGISAQGYEIDADDDSVTIHASDADGLFYGCNDLIKQLLVDGSVSDKVDQPHVLERAVSLDNGRKYYSVEWIKEFIREMAWANMNTLVLHFTEEMGIGIESKLYPWLNGRDGELCTQAEVADDERVLTQEEVIDIMAYAKLYHIDIIPSLDSPGHMNYMVKKFNEQCATKDFSFTYRGVTYTAEAGSEIGNYYHYNGKTSIVKGSRNANYSRGIDISNEIAVAFTKSLIEEYANLFHANGSTKFDIGGDELLGWGSAIVSGVNKWEQLDHWKEYAQKRTGNSNAVAYDAFLLYMNDLNDLVRELGYTSVRMWNDDALRSSDTGWTGVVNLDTDIDIWFWTTGNNIFYDYANADYQLYNIISDYNYYAMTSDYFSSNRGSFAQAYADEIYNEWNPYIFYPANLNAGWKYNPGVTNPNVLGGAFGIWSDNPTLRTEAQVMSDVLPLIRANAAKSWDVDAQETVDYATYVANWNKVGSAPAGLVAAPEVGTAADPTALLEAIAAYEQVNAAMYTPDSFAPYTAAVNAARELLSADYYAQADVDAALANIQAAVNGLVKISVNTDALSEAIAAYAEVDGTLYTAESFAAYTAAVTAAKELLNSGVYNQEAVDAALANIQAAVEALVEIENPVYCVISGTARSSRVNVGKTCVLTVGVVKSVAVNGLRIFDEDGKEITPSQTSTNTKKSDRNTHTFTFKVTADDRGMHTYTAYAVLADGSLSADFVRFEIEVR